MWFRVATMIAVASLFVLPLRAENVKPAADPARVTAARDLMTVLGVTKQMDTAIDTMKTAFLQSAKSASNEQKEKFSAEFDKSIANLMAYREDMMNDFAHLYAETFTAEEMKTVADFYRSGAGAKFIQATPDLMQKGAAIGMSYSTKVMDEMRRTAPAEAPKP